MDIMSNTTGTRPFGAREFIPSSVRGQFMIPVTGLDSMAQSMIGGMRSAKKIEGNRNICPKHKCNYINFCLDHGVPLCAECFDKHKDHKI